MTNIEAQTLPETVNANNSTKIKLVATGGILGALAASMCCIARSRCSSVMSSTHKS